MVFLQDGRRVPASEELFLWEFFREQGRRVIPVLTKADKLKRGERSRQLKLFAEALTPFGVDPGEVIWFSALTREGRDRLWDRLLACLGGPENREGRQFKGVSGRHKVSPSWGDCAGNFPAPTHEKRPCPLTAHWVTGKIIV